MPKKRIQRCFWWLDEWQLAEQEAWLQDMSRDGWHLVKTGLGRATFEQDRPRKYRYRCDVFPARKSSEQDRLDLYAEAGWEHVANRGLVQIFRAPEDAHIPEIHTDPLEQLRNIRRLLPRRLASFLVPLLFLAVFIFESKSQPAKLLLRSNWLFVLSILFFLAWLVRSFQSLLRLVQYMARLRRGQHSAPSIRWRQAIRRAQLRLALLLITWLLLVGGKLLPPLLALEPPFPPIPEEDLPVVRLSQVLDSSQYANAIPNPGYYKGKGDLFNYYREESSLLVPEQYFLAQSVKVPTSDSQIMTIFFYCDAYRTITPGFAKTLANGLAQQRTRYPTRSSLPLSSTANTHGFDGFWLLEEEDQLEVIVWQNNWVYHLSSSGNQIPLERILQVLSSHIKS